MITITRTFDPSAGLTRVDHLTGYVFNPEANAHRFVIENADPTQNGGVTAYFLRADNVTVLIDDGQMVMGNAIIDLPRACYRVPGRFVLTIYVDTATERTCVYAATATVSIGASDTILHIQGRAAPGLTLGAGTSDEVTVTAAQMRQLLALLNN